VRGEGVVGAVIDNLLQEVDGKLIEDRSRESHAIIDRVSVKFSAFEATLTAPQGAHLQVVMQEALTAAGIAGTSVDHLESHGSGQPMWDGVEVSASQKVLAPEGGDARPIPLMVSAVHSNIGQNKVPAAAFGFIKAIVTGLHGIMTSSIHLHQLNPLLRDAVEQDCGLLTEGLAFAAAKSIIGVTGLGFSGTLAHAILEVDRTSQDDSQSGPTLIPVFWRQEESNM